MPAIASGKLHISGLANAQLEVLSRSDKSALLSQIRPNKIARTRAGAPDSDQRTIKAGRYNVIVRIQNSDVYLLQVFSNERRG
jgi:hypothetical protein